MKYELFTNASNEEYVIRTNDEGVVSFILCDPANSDYQAYLNKDNPDWNKPNI